MSMDVINRPMRWSGGVVTDPRVLISVVADKSSSKPRGLQASIGTTSNGYRIRFLSSWIVPYYRSQDRSTLSCGTLHGSSKNHRTCRSDLLPFVSMSIVLGERPDLKIVVLKHRYCTLLVQKGRNFVTVHH